MDRRSFIESILGALVMPKAELAQALSGDGVIYKICFIGANGPGVDLNFVAGIKISELKRSIEKIKEDLGFVWELTVEKERAIIQETWSPLPEYTLASESSG